MSRRLDPKFIKTPLIGGVIFLIPFVFLSIVLSKALKITRSLAQPLNSVIPFEKFYGVAILDILAMAIVVGVCFLAGLYARGPRSNRVTGAIDEKLLMAIPTYAFVKGFAGSISELDDVLTPVILKLDDTAQIGLEVERKVGGLAPLSHPGLSSDRNQPD